MSERVTCTACGVAILASTAERTGGLCMPCKGGYRQEIEDGRRRRALELRIGALAPQARYRCAEYARMLVVSRGNSTLTREESLFFSLLMLGLDVFEGGFDTYFWNVAADMYEDALRALNQLGAHQARRDLMDAKQALFGLGQLPKTPVRRRIMSSKHISRNRKLDSYLLQLENKFILHSERIVEWLEQFSKTGLIPA